MIKQLLSNTESKKYIKTFLMKWIGPMFITSAIVTMDKYYLLLE